MAMINVGSKENPVMVPEEAMNPETDQGQEWWGGVADGSIIIEEDALDLLLSDDRLRQGDGKSE